MQQLLEQNTPVHTAYIMHRVRSAMLQYLQEKKIKVKVGKKVAEAILANHRFVIDKYSELYIAEHLYKRLPENTEENAFDNLLAICLTHTSDVSKTPRTSKDKLKKKSDS